MLPTIFFEAQSFQMHLWRQLRPILVVLVHDRGIQIDPKKLQARRDMPPPNSLKKLQCFVGEVNYLRRLLPQLAAKALTLTCMLCEPVSFQWTSDCQAAFEALKAEVLKPPTLLAPTSGLPFILDISNTDLATAAVLAQADQDGIEILFYYLSRAFTAVKQRYHRIEKVCCPKVVTLFLYLLGVFGCP